MTMTIQGAGVELACEVRGDGVPVLLVHGMASDARSWTWLSDELAAGATRTIAYDRRGYGGSEAPEPYEGTTVMEQAQDARAVLHAFAGDAGTLACGADLGALIVLDLLVHSPGLLRGAVLVAPPVHQFSLDATEVLSRERAALEQALRDGGPEAAVAVLRADADAVVRAAHRAVFADYGGLASWPVTRAELRAVDVPVVVVTPADAPAHLREEAEALVRLLPQGRRVEDGDPLAPLRELLAEP
jgi:pimeloyl-ACP methyl ester carboxylesterase